MIGYNKLLAQMPMRTGKTTRSNMPSDKYKDLSEYYDKQQGYGNEAIAEKNRKLKEEANARFGGGYFSPQTTSSAQEGPVEVYAPTSREHSPRQGLDSVVYHSATAPTTEDHYPSETSTSRESGSSAGYGEGSDSGSFTSYGRGGLNTATKGYLSSTSGGKSSSYTSN